MGRVREAFCYPDDTPDHLWEPSEEELEAMEAAYSAAYEAECSPKPIPCDPSEEHPSLTAWDLFTPEIVARVIEQNQGWMQWTNRTTSEVLGALFINVDYAGMTDVQAMRRVSNIIHDAGYTPSNQSPNPTWTFPV
jgi:hypothetical protein